MPHIKKFFIILGIVLLLFCGFVLLWVNDQYVVPIMMYHNVEDLYHQEGNYVSPQFFEKHMKYLKDNNYNVLSLDELVSLTQSGKSIKKKSVAISFDDGYRNNYDYAFEILKKYNFPAIIFVPSDSMHAEDRLSVEQIREMNQSNIDIGSHTRREAYLPKQTKALLLDEIVESKRILEEKTGIKINYISYPTGGFNDDVKQIVKESGYKGACTTNRGFDRLNKDVFELNRIRFSNKDNQNVILWIKLSGYYNFFRKTKNPY